MKPGDFIEVVRTGASTWHAGGYEIKWDFFPSDGISGFDKTRRESLITPVMHPRTPGEVTSVNITGLGYAYQFTGQKKFLLTKAQFVVYFLGIPGRPPLFRFKSPLVQSDFEEKIYQSIKSLHL